jgi:hypothetical protein
MRRCVWPPGRCGLVLPVGRGASPPRPTGPGAPSTDRGSEDGSGAPGWDQARECPVPQPGRGCSPCGGHAANAPSDARHARAGGGKSGRTLLFRVAVMCDRSTVIILKPVSENPWSSASIRDSFEQSFEHIYSKPRVRQDRNDGRTSRQDLSRSCRRRALSRGSSPVGHVPRSHPTPMKSQVKPHSGQRPTRTVGPSRPTAQAEPAIDPTGVRRPVPDVRSRRPVPTSHERRIAGGAYVTLGPMNRCYGPPVRRRHRLPGSARLQAPMTGGTITWPVHCRTLSLRESAPRVPATTDDRALLR